MTPQQRLDYLLAPAGVANGNAVTGADITLAVGMDQGRLVLGTIQAAASQDPLIAMAFQALATVGMRLDLPERQDMIDQLASAGDWPEETRDAVKNLGVDNRPRWLMQGYLAAPTLADATADVAVANALESVSTRYNNAVASLAGEHTDILDLAALQAYCDAVVASVDGLVS